MATIQSLVTSVNCLIDTTERNRSSSTEISKPGVSVDTFKIFGKQRTQAYGKVVFAVLAAPNGDTTQSALVLPDKGQASVPTAAGAECKAKINSDNTVDAQCDLAGAELYVVYRN